MRGDVVGRSKLFATASPKPQCVRQRAGPQGRWLPDIHGRFLASWRSASSSKLGETDSGEWSRSWLSIAPHGQIHSGGVNRAEEIKPEERRRIGL